MKALICKVLAVATLIVSSVVGSVGQNRTVEREFSEYDAVSVSGDFKVSFSRSTAGSYSAKITVDDAFESYVQCYVKAKTLYIGLDEKEVPKDLKKQFKGKNSSGPAFSAVIYLPVLKSVSLNGASSFSSSSPLEADEFNLNMTDESSVSNLDINSKDISLKINKKSKMTSCSAKGDDIEVSGDGSAEVTLEYSAKKLEVSSAGSANLTLNGEAEKVTVTTSNNSKTFVSGKASSLKAQGGGGSSLGGSSLIDAGALAVLDAAVAVNSAEVKVNSENTLSLDLGKGAKVSFKGEPVISIVGIQNSSVTRE